MASPINYVLPDSGPFRFIHEFVRITSSRYLSDGDIRVCFIMDGNSAQKLTGFLYDHQDELDIDILEAGKD